MGFKIVRHQAGGATVYTSWGPDHGYPWTPFFGIDDVVGLADDELQRLFGAELRALALTADIEDEE